MASRQPRKVLTMEELANLIEDGEDNDPLDQITLVTVLPPTNDGDVTDEEEFNEDEIVFNDNVSAYVELAGQFECETLGDIEGYAEILAGLKETTDNAEVTPFGKKTFKKLKTAVSCAPKSPNWINNGDIKYDWSETTATLEGIENELVEKTKFLSPVELFLTFFDTEVLEFIKDSTITYAKQKNCLNFSLEVPQLKRFLSILLISGYHTLPALTDYWSVDPTLGVPIVKQAMPRNRFIEIKKYLHFCDNNNLSKGDKYSKVRPFFDLMNLKFMQYGVWTNELSIDEQMVAYFGRHSCKMYIRGKPIRFGYKLWCLCSSSGYLYSFIPYAGADGSYDANLGLGATTIVRLLQNVPQPECHKLYFDNFFSSYNLMVLLKDKHMKASGTVRPNRTGKASLKTGKDLPKGQFHYTFDDVNKILVCRWQDNKEVSVISNFDYVHPTVNVKRWTKKKLNKDGSSEAGKHVAVHQPGLFQRYNNGMGGVDLHDNAVQNYRIAIRGKKWYFPLFTTCVDSALVNAWKIHCFLSKVEKRKQMSQKDFPCCCHQSFAFNGRQTRGKSAI